MMAAVMTAAPAFHIGDTIEIETLLNGRSDKNFLSDQRSKNRYVITQLPKGTLGKIEAIHPFAKTGNTGLYITVTSGPNAGKKYWVLNRRGKHYLKLYDSKEKETDSTQDAAELETQQDIGAVHDRQPASATNETKAEEKDVPQRVLDLSQFIKSAGESPQSDCPDAQAPQQEATSEVLPPAPAEPVAPAEKLSEAKAKYYLRSSPRVQTSDPQIQQLAQEITRGRADDYSKAMAIHDWVANNVDYDTDAYFNEFLKDKEFSRPYDALSVLNRKPGPTAICSGYANLTIALLRAAKIPAREIEGLLHYDGPPPGLTCDGFEKKKNAHGWLEVWVDGKWLAMDTTADAGYTDYKKEIYIKSPSRKFMDSKIFNKTHTHCIINNYY
jgi:transglutaminase/protease-like cytokinesis protein 3